MADVNRNTRISVNQAAIWLALRRKDWPESIQGFGSLLTI